MAEDQYPIKIKSHRRCFRLDLGQLSLQGAKFYEKAADSLSAGRGCMYLDDVDTYNHWDGISGGKVGKKYWPWRMGIIILWQFVHLYCALWGEREAGGKGKGRRGGERKEGREKGGRRGGGRRGEGREEGGGKRKGRGRGIGREKGKGEMEEREEKGRGKWRRQGNGRGKEEVWLNRLNRWYCS